jgi:hypothetical protein
VSGQSRPAASQKNQAAAGTSSPAFPSTSTQRPLEAPHATRVFRIL